MKIFVTCCAIKIFLKTQLKLELMEEIYSGNVLYLRTMQHP